MRQLMKAIWDRVVHALMGLQGSMQRVPLIKYAPLSRSTQLVVMLFRRMIGAMQTLNNFNNNAYNHRPIEANKSPVPAA